jgi:hypothetical protein
LFHHFAAIHTIIVGIYTTAVKNQGYCGCCWAFASVEQIESDAIRTKNWSVNSPLSTAQVCVSALTFLTALDAMVDGQTVRMNMRSPLGEFNLM